MFQDLSNRQLILLKTEPFSSLALKVIPDLT